VARTSFKENGVRLHSLRLISAMGLAAFLFHGTYADAATRNPWAVSWGTPSASSTTGQPKPWAVSFLPVEAAPGESPAMTLKVSAQQPAQDAPTVRPKSFDYSHGYEVRLKIHKWASYATLPLFATEIYLGEKLYSGNYDPFGSTRGAHQFVASTLAVLFGVNTVTGVWNLKEGWKDPAHHNRRVIHGILMLASDAGFAATGATAPNQDGTSGNRGAHRAWAYTSVGIATAGYLMMIFGK
jgi:hypothetical protein